MLSVTILITNTFLVVTECETFNNINEIECLEPTSSTPFTTDVPTTITVPTTTAVPTAPTTSRRTIEQITTQIASTTSVESSTSSMLYITF